MDQQETATSGKSFYQARGWFLPMIVTIGALVAFLNKAPGPFADDAANTSWLWASFAVAALGALIRIITSGYAARGTSGNTKDEAEAAELNTTGPYSLVRNPLYVGRILNFTGIAMLTGSALYGIAVFLFSSYAYARISDYEAGFLRTKFGAAYDAWAKNIPALIPRLTGWVKPRYPFWWRRMLWRENKKVFMLALAVVLFDLARSGFHMSRIDEVVALYWAFAIMAAIQIGFRVARHFTPVFADLR